MQPADRLTAGDAVLVLSPGSAGASTAAADDVLRLHLDGANPLAQASGIDPLALKSQ